MPPDLVQYGLAFLEGLGLVFSPCILPVLPLVLAGGSTGGRSKPFGVITGFIAAFSLFALASRQIFLSFGIAQDSLQQVAFGLLAVMGLVMALPALDEKFARLTQGLAARAQGWLAHSDNEGFGGGLATGALIGLVWTPCGGGIFAVAVAQTVQSSTSLQAAMIVLMFSLGTALPMLAIMLTGKALARHFSRYSVGIKRALGIVLFIFGLLGVTGKNPAVLLTQYFESVPGLTAGQKFGPGLAHGLDQPYAAPEIAGITHWINTKALTLADLKGKVVLVDFWTYSCINCLRTLPYIKAWYEKYHDKGFEIVGVHAPEFAFEGKPENVEAAVKQHGLKYPVAMDNNFATWSAYKNQYWPAHYLIDKEGRVVYTHFGEGRYDVTEHNIRALLSLGADDTPLEKGKKVTSNDQTPETYLGTDRAEREWDKNEKMLPLHAWKLKGAWRRTPHFIESSAAEDTLVLHFNARKVFLVMSSADGTPVQARVRLLDTSVPNAAADLKDGEVTVSGARLYELASLPKTTDGMLWITVEKPGLQAYAFTFEAGE